MLSGCGRAGINAGWHGFEFCIGYRLHASPTSGAVDFVEAGWSAPEALVAATKINSEILDMDDAWETCRRGSWRTFWSWMESRTKICEDLGQGGFGDSGTVYKVVEGGM